MAARSLLRAIVISDWEVSISGLPRGKTRRISGQHQSIPAIPSTVPGMTDRLHCPGTVKPFISFPPGMVASAAETSGLLREPNADLEVHEYARPGGAAD